ncbi:MAG: eukaryotic-like serine/threonine-protein kinase [Miltoncostaeaceae bacterium]|nr:eukaryotic-like serine/threonine-protein kinase [Miltoncostaeaceae bacterium]
MKRTMRPAAIAAILTIGVVGIVAGCGGGSPASTTPTQAAAAPLPMSARVLRVGDLPGFTPRTPQLMGLELVDDISDSEHAAADKQALTDAGFVEGTLGKLDGAEGTYAVSFAVRLGSAASTAGLLDHMYTSARETGDANVQSADLPLSSIPGAKAVTLSGSNSDGPIRGSAVMVADGPFVYGIQVVRQGETSVAGEATEAALRLFARVKGSPLAAEPPAAEPTPTPTPTEPTPAAPAAAFPNAGEQALLQHVPQSSRSACDRTSETGRADEATFSVRCDLPDGLYVYYEQFADAAAAGRSYQTYLTANTIPKAAGSCATELPGENGWNNGTGRLACWQSAGRVWIAWTHEALKMVSVATSPGTDMATLFSWWKSADSGPVE